MPIINHHLQIGDYVKVKYTIRKNQEGRIETKGHVVQITPYLIVLEPNDSFYNGERVTVMQADLLIGEAKLKKI